MRFKSVVFVAVVGMAVVVVQGAGVPNDAASVTHALNRLAFGARPGQVEHVQRIGLDRWIEQQLAPGTSDAALAARLARLDTLALPSSTIMQDYFLPARRERQARQRAAADGQPAAMQEAPAMTAPSPDAVRQRRFLADLSEAKLLRAVYSERQLEEVLVDFWFNHFNVFARKGLTSVFVGEYERDTIRPHVLGNFRALLGATAKSPAMLFYLDNWQSASPEMGELARRARPRAQGLNENYARELLELHTLGVDGGYTQADIMAVARAFTGWTIDRREARFRFVPAMHDRGEKMVLGTTLPSRGGIADGERVLDLLARHPSTARHIAFKLVERFVSDTPPLALVERAARTFTTTEGDLREVVRAIVTSPEFFAPVSRHAKVKTPFEFVASALRATDAEIANGLAVVRALTDMGMPLYLCQPPTGYDETSEAWVSSGGLVARINFALALTRGEVRGLRLARRTTGSETDALHIGSAEFQRQ